MSTTKEVASLFKEGADKLPPITGKPTNNDLKRMRELLSNLLQAVEVPGGTDSEGLITTKADYKAAHAGVNFDCFETSSRRMNRQFCPTSRQPIT